MGSVLSSTASQNDSYNPNSSSEPSNPTTVSSGSESPDSLTPKQSDQATKPTDQENEIRDTDQSEEDEEGECGFCLFIKGGGCKDAFVDWENCVKEVELKKEDVEKCYDATKALRECMLNHPDYYAPILVAEQAAEKKVQEAFGKTKGSEELVPDGTGKKKMEKVVDSKDLESRPESLDSVAPKLSDQATKSDEEIENGDIDQGEKDEEGECGFCLFMKGGGCNDAFVDWENCVKEMELKREDVARKCYVATKALSECMLNHPDYYASILEAEQAAEKKVQSVFGKKKGSQESESDEEGNGEDCGFQRFGKW